jgi:hypothetical protein
MNFDKVHLTSAEHLKLRMLKCKVAFRQNGFQNSYGVLRMYSELYPYESEKEITRVRNVYALTCTDEDIISRFEHLV